MELVKHFNSSNCCLCLSSFIINGYSVSHTLKVPYTISCGHSACEKCLKSELSSKNQLVCNVCKSVTTAPNQFDINDLAQAFPVNFFFLGMWYYGSSSFNMSDLDSSIRFSKPILNKKKIKHKTVTCNECMENTANSYCKQCNAPYCTKCFRLVHISARAFRSHVKVPLFDKLFNLETNKPLMCVTHTEVKLEIYCTQCRAIICSRCMVESHNGHTVDILENVNIDYQEQFIEHYLKVNEVLGQLKSSKKKVEGALCENKDAAAIKKVNEKMFDFFLQVHGKLGVLQNNMHSKLNLADTSKQLESLLEIINEAVNSTEVLLTSTKYVIADHSQQKPATFICLVENLKAKENLPCHLLEDNFKPPPRFIFDEDLFKQLEHLCDIEITSGDKFRLVQDKDLPPGYEISPSPRLTREDVLALLSESAALSDTSSVTSEQYSERPISPVLSSSSEKSFHSPLIMNKRKDGPPVYTDDIAIGCQIRVRISHLVSPSDFYVQRECAEKKMHDFQASLRQCNLSTSKPLSHFVKGKVYLGLYEPDSKWYRARIIEIVDDKIKVLYIDFGNTEYLNPTRLRLLPKNCLNIPILSYRCRLNNCVPRQGEDWEPASVALMAEIIDNDFVTMYVVNRSPVCYVVDLYKIGVNLIINIRDALLFQGYAALADQISVSSTSNNIIQLKSETIQLPKQHIQPGSILEVHVSQVISPHDFYVQNMWSSKKLIKMSDELQRAYNIRNQHKFTIYNPVEGLYVVARYSADKKWYRGQITACRDNKMIQVFFIDFGKEEEVSWENVKLLQSKFSTLSPQALKCVLADVQPLEGHDAWSDEACDFFHKNVFDKKLKLVVESQSTDHINVILYKSQKEADFCINALLVRENLAISTGVHSTVAEFPKVYSRPKQGFFQCEVEVENINKEKQIFVPPKMDKSTVLSSIEKGPNGKVCVNIIVKRLISPGEFYITPTCFKNMLTSLEVGLQKFYERSRECENKEWTPDERCVAKSDGKWYRAYILEVLEEGKLKVALADEGYEIIVDKKCIRPIHNKFLCLVDGATKCHLGGLEASQEQWSSSSITEFQDFVNKYQDSLYLCDLGKAKEGTASVPVELFSRINIQNGPTEPNTAEWRSLNHYLRIIGLAKPDNRVQWDCDGNILNWSELDDKKDNENEEAVMNKLFSSSFKLSSDTEENENEEGAGLEPISMTVEETQSSVDVKGTSDPQSIFIPSAWLPPLPLEELTFVAAPTYVDSDCNVYLHDFHKSNIILEEISNALCTKYDETLPKPCDATVQPGDICIAQYHLDKKWYRAILIDRKEEFDEYTIHFVDYGNEETCKLSELRKIPVTHHIPIQATKCCFHTLVPCDPSGKWETRHIEIIQYNVVDKKCQVKLVKLSDSDLYGIEKLILPDGRNYISEIISEGFAQYKDSAAYMHNESPKKETDENKDVIKNLETETLSDAESESTVEHNDSAEVCDSEIPTESALENVCQVEQVIKKTKLLHWSFLIKELVDEDDMPTLKYQELILPPLVDTLIVEATAFLSPTQIILHLEDVEEDPDIIEKLCAFKELSETLQQDGPSQPLLSPPFKYKPCCAQFSADKIWYRGFVLDELPYGFLLVQYVDYGNVESLPAHSVRELKEEWASLEVLGLVGELNKISVAEDTDHAELMQTLSETLTIEGGLKAIIKDRAPLKVDLYSGDELAYEKLIDLNLFNQH